MPSNQRGLAAVTGLVLFLLTGVVPLAQGGELPRETTLPLEMALKAAGAAVDRCKNDGYRVTATVVDRGGLIRAQLRGDGASPHTLDSSRKKAYTAASLRRTTSDLGELIAKMPGLQGLRDMNHEILMLGGGLPVEFNGEVVGGIGVGGAPGTHLDDACAEAGLSSIGATSKVSSPSK